ncbi:hypothetical protein [Streptomyces sp. NPDC002104]
MMRPHGVAATTETVPATGHWGAVAMTELSLMTVTPVASSPVKQPSGVREPKSTRV